MWTTTFFNDNSVGDIVLTFFLFNIGAIVLLLIKKVVVVRLKRFAEHTRTELDDVFVEVLESVSTPVIFFLSLLLSMYHLQLGSVANTVIQTILLSVVTYQVIIGSQYVVKFLIRKWTLDKHTQDSVFAFQVLTQIASAVLWLLGILFVLSNLGVNITSLIAGLGIGGVAVALALQNILGDLFSYFAIYFDKPFVVGDFIIVGNDMGVVEHVGIKTSRIRALGGQQIVISNQELTTHRINNYKRMQERRIVFHFGVEYSTDNHTMKRIPEVVRHAIEREESTRFDRAHFYNFGDSSLDFEVVYFVLSADYNEYMDKHQAILLQVKEDVEQMGASMAFPTRTVHVASMPKTHLHQSQHSDS